MTAWHLGPMAPFDLETTSDNPEEARICSAYVGRVGGGLPGAVDVCDLFVDPGIEVPAESTKIHGLTTEFLREHGTAAPAAVDTIAAAVAVAVQEGVPLVGHYISYDFTVLDRECRRHRLPTVHDRTGGILGPVIDTHVLSKHVDQFRRRDTDIDPTTGEPYGAQRLRTCAKAFRVPWVDENAHGARYDALIAARVAWRIGQIAATPLAERRPAQGRILAAFDHVAVGLPELHQTQKQWAAEQAAGLADYFRGQARQARDVDEQIEWHARADSCSGAWPITPFEQQGALT